MGWVDMVACRLHLLSTGCGRVQDTQPVQGRLSKSARLLASLSAGTQQSKSRRRWPGRSAASITLRVASAHRWRLKARSRRQLSKRALSTALRSQCWHRDRGLRPCLTPAWQAMARLLLQREACPQWKLFIQHTPHLGLLC